MNPLPHRSCPHHVAAAPALALALLLSLLAAPVHAQFKVVDAEGKVTYSDRVPSASEGRVSALGARGAASAAEPDLPYDLRVAASRYPVTLYTANGTCEPCTQGRQLLKQRGIPYLERQAVTSEDVDALEKLSGGRDAPTLTIGSQVLRGLAQDTWTQYLDAAGYPRESHLPASYQQRPVASVAERREAPVARSAAASAPARASRPLAANAPPAPGGIRF